MQMYKKLMRAEAEKELRALQQYSKHKKYSQGVWKQHAILIFSDSRQ